jgi:hypothetical protein
MTTYATKRFIFTLDYHTFTLLYMKPFNPTNLSCLTLLGVFMRVYVVYNGWVAVLPSLFLSSLV